MTDAPATILVLDDNDTGRYVKARILMRAGYTVITASTGNEALNLISEQRPNLAVLDVQLPDMSGLDLCRRLKAEDSPILVLQTSATYVRGQDRIDGLDSGADAYLTEPIEPEELLATVRALLRIGRAESALRRLNDTLEQRVEERTRELADANTRITREILDRQKVEEAFRQAQKMEAIGQLTGGIAHDFNNLLTVIYGGLESIQRKLQVDDARLIAAINHSMIAAKRAAALTQRLLAFARRQPLEPKITDINGLVRDTSEMLRRTLGDRAELKVTLAEDLWLAAVDNNQLETSLLNLAVNARDAIADWGQLAIETSNVHMDSVEVASQETTVSGDFVRLSVSDTGKGMAAEVLEKAFDPFFTTKPRGQGTGLGLSQVYGFVKQSGGHITIDSQPEVGTTVTILLPKSSGSLSSFLSPPTAVAPAIASNSTILVVEDDDGVRAYSAYILREMGYQVIESETAEMALDLLRDNTDISVLFTDIGLPGASDGFQLATEAKTLLPHLKVMYMTGYLQEPAHQFDIRESYVLVRKPFTYADLAAKLRDALTHGAAP